MLPGRFLSSDSIFSHASSLNAKLSQSTPASSSVVNECMYMRAISSFNTNFPHDLFTAITFTVEFM